MNNKRISSFFQHTCILVRTWTATKKISISELPKSENTKSSDKDPKIAFLVNFEHFLQIVDASHKAAFSALIISLSDNFLKMNFEKI